MQEKLVSIIIPCYNQEHFLEETVSSALASTHFPIEIILVNDGSTDNTERVGLRLAERHQNIHYYSQPNSGPSVARNHGISMAKGKYILPLDGDDLIAATYISSAVEVLEAHPQVKVVYCQAEKFGHKNGPWKLKPFSLEALAMDNMIFVSGIYRKEDWRKSGGYASEMTWGYEDWEFWISMLKDGGQVVQLPLVGFFYRTSPSSRRKSVKRAGKKKTVQFLNKKHRDFLYAQLHGPLRMSRSNSRRINKLLNAFGLIPK